MESPLPESEFDGREFNIESSLFLPPVSETDLKAFLDDNPESTVEIDLQPNLKADLESKVTEHGNGDEVSQKVFQNVEILGSQLHNVAGMESNQTAMFEKSEEFPREPPLPDDILPTIKELEQLREMSNNEEAIDAIVSITRNLESPEVGTNCKMDMENKGIAGVDVTNKLKTPVSLISEEACLPTAGRNVLKEPNFVYDPSDKFAKGSLWGLFALSFQMNEAHEFAAYTREDMKRQFSEFGKVVRVNFAYHQDGNRIITVWFTDEDSAKYAIESLRNVYHGLKLKNVASTLLKSFNNGGSKCELNGSLCFNNKLGIPIDKIGEEWKKFGDVEVINLAKSKVDKRSCQEVYICFKDVVEMNAAMQHFILEDQTYPDLDLAAVPIGVDRQGRKSDTVSRKVGENIMELIQLSIENSPSMVETETPKGKWPKNLSWRKGGQLETRENWRKGGHLETGNGKKRLEYRKDSIPRAPPNTPSNSTDQILGIKSLTTLNDTKCKKNPLKSFGGKDQAPVLPLPNRTHFPSNREAHISDSQLKLETVKENEIIVENSFPSDLKSEEESLDVNVPTLLQLEISNCQNTERSENAKRELIQITRILEQAVDDGNASNQTNTKQVGHQLTPVSSPFFTVPSLASYIEFPSPGAEMKTSLSPVDTPDGKVQREPPFSPSNKIPGKLNAEKGHGHQNAPVSSLSNVSSDEKGLLDIPDSIAGINFSLSPISGKRPLDENVLELSPVISPIRQISDLKVGASADACFSFSSPVVSSPNSRYEVPFESPNISSLQADLDSTSLSLILLNDKLTTSNALQDKNSFQSDRDVVKSANCETTDDKLDITPVILPDVFGHYGLVMCVYKSDADAQIEEIRQDFEFFGDLVSLAWRTDTCIVKFADTESTKAAFFGLKEKYKHLRPFEPVDIGPDNLGRFTLTFLDKKGKRYAGTKEEFYKYGAKTPLIAKGEGRFLIRISYSDKKGALEALLNNVSNPEFPELQIAPECEISPPSSEGNSLGILSSQNSSISLSATNDTANDEVTGELRFPLNYETNPILCEKNVFDSHCHIDLMLPKLTKSKKTWSQFKSKNTDWYNENWFGCITVMCDPSTWNKESRMKHFHEPDVWATIGCHPKHAASFTGDKLKEMKRLIAENGRIIAVGEIGLDATHEDKSKYEDQEKTFRKCLEVAVELDKPVCLHIKERMKEARQIMREVGVGKNHKIHFHCCGRSDTWEGCQELMEEYPNLKVGLTPLVTFKNAGNVQNVAVNLPLDRMLLETDSPYFYPRLADKSQPKCSHPGLVIHTASQVALLKGIPVEDVLAANRKNVLAVYGV